LKFLPTIAPKEAIQSGFKISLARVGRKRGGRAMTAAAPGRD